MQLGSHVALSSLAFQTSTPALSQQAVVRISEPSRDAVRFDLIGSLRL